MKSVRVFFTAMVICLSSFPAYACTGITLRTEGGNTVAARTIEWAGSDLESRYVVVPRGYTQRSYVPGGKKDGMLFTSRYGYIGLSVERAEYVVDGMNEKGLSAGLFYFPDCGTYERYDALERDSSVSDLQLVPWILGQCSTVDEVMSAVGRVHVVSADERGSTVHWRFTDTSGRQVVLEIVGGRKMWHENALGVLTNSPDFGWHLKNLNNYANLYPGRASGLEIGGMHLKPFGGGGGLYGIPGDMTPPSRFVRAAFFLSAAPCLSSSEETVMQAFHILNNFDLPIGVQTNMDVTVPDIPSATQWTVACDIGNRRIYYRTMYDSTIRCFDLKATDFVKVKYASHPLDAVKRQPVRFVKVQTD